MPHKHHLSLGYPSTGVGKAIQHKLVGSAPRKNTYAHIKHIKIKK